MQSYVVTLQSLNSTRLFLPDGAHLEEFLSLIYVHQIHNKLYQEEEDI